MARVISFILIGLLVPSLCFGAEITTARGLTLVVKDNTTLYGSISFHKGVIEDVENVTFVGWNFSRDTAHSEVFINCKNLVFKDCNLVNVELQEDFTIDGSLVLHENRYKEDGIEYVEQELKNNKTKKYRIGTDKSITLTETKDTKNAKKIKVKYKNVKSNIVSNLNADVIK